MGQIRVRLDLTPAQADALLTMACEAEAGDLYETLGRSGTAVRSAEAAMRALRNAIAAARGRQERKHNNGA